MIVYPDGAFVDTASVWAMVSRESPSGLVEEANLTVFPSAPKNMVDVEMLKVKDCATVAVTATVSLVIMLVVMIPLSPNDPLMRSAELVAEDGLVICAVPDACDIALVPNLICTQRFAGITADPEVIVILCDVVETPHVSPEAALFVRNASVNPEQVDEVLVAKSVLEALTEPRFQPTGKVIVIPNPAPTPVGVTN